MGYVSKSEFPYTVPTFDSIIFLYATEKQQEDSSIGKQYPSHRPQPKLNNEHPFTPEIPSVVIEYDSMVHYASSRCVRIPFKSYVNWC